ncbi:hypothetical protein ACFL5X_03970 [Candidatus Omnitrophota bacterium]
MADLAAAETIFRVVNNDEAAAFNVAGNGDSQVQGFLSVTGLGAAVGDGSNGVTVELDGGAGENRSLLYRSGGSDRWAIVVNNTAEGGSNVGSDLDIYRYSDAGIQIEKALYIARSTGDVTLAQDLTVNESFTFDTGVSVSSILDEDNMASNSAASLATQQSIKMYVDATAGGEWTDQTGYIEATDAASGTNYVVVTDTGNVGIGTTDTQDKRLYVDGETILDGRVDIYDDDFAVGNDDFFMLRVTDATTTQFIRYDSGESEIAGTLQIGDTEDVDLIVSGNVGIGTTAPASKLEIDAASSVDVLTLKNTGGNDIRLVLDRESTSDQGFLDFSTDTSGQFLIGLNDNGDDDFVIIAGTSSSQEVFSISDGPGNFIFSPEPMTSGSPTLLTLTGPAHTTLANAEASDVNFALNRTVQFGQSTTLALQRAFKIQAPTYSSSAGTKTITDAATVGITGAPVKSTNVAIPNTHALYIGAGAVSTATNSYGLTVNAQTGASNNFAAEFLGGNVGIGITTPAAKLDIANVSDTNMRLRGPTPASEIGDIRVGGDGMFIFSTQAASASNAYIDIQPNDDAFGLMLRECDGVDNAVFANFYVKKQAGDDYLNIVLNTAQDTYGLVLTESENVGIGTSTPDAELDIAGSLKFDGEATEVSSILDEDNMASNLATALATQQSIKMYVDSQVGGGEWTDQTGYIEATDAAAGTNYVVVTDGGNVGIGTTAPIRSLHVAGGVMIDNYEYIFSKNTSGSVTRMMGINDSDEMSIGSVDLNIPVMFTAGGGLYPFQIEAQAEDESLYIKQDGNVGIGTTAPEHNLHTYSASVNNGIYVENDADNAYISLDAGGTDEYPTINFFHAGDNYWTISSDGLGADQGLFILSDEKTGGAERVVQIDKEGNVGIGTTAPDKLLTVETSATNVIVISTKDNQNKGVNIGSTTDSGLVRATGGERLSLGADNTSDHIVIATTGNVGIGTTVPTSTLVVDGNAQLGDAPTIDENHDFSIGRDATNPIAATSSEPFDEILISPTFTQSVDESEAYSGVLRALAIWPYMTGAGDISTYVGLLAQPEYEGTGEFYNDVIGVEVRPIIKSGTIPDVKSINPWGTMSGGTVDRWTHVDIWNVNLTGGSIADLYGIYVHSLTAGSNNYAIGIDQAAGADNYAIYSEGPAKSYFAGNVGIATTAPNNPLEVRIDNATVWTGTNSYQSVIRGYNTDTTAGAAASLQLQTANGGIAWLASIQDATAFKTQFAIKLREGVSAYTEMLRIDTSGNVGIGTTAPTAKLEINGNLKAALGNVADSNPLYTTNTSGVGEIGYDVAELFDASSEVEVGDIVVLDADSPNSSAKVRKSHHRSQANIVGVVSGAPAILFEGSSLEIAPTPGEFIEGLKPPVALAGRVPVKVCTENGPINRGDYITTSSRAGVGMKAEIGDPIVGFALEAFSGKESDSGIVRVFIANENNLYAKHLAGKLKAQEAKISTQQLQLDSLISRLTALEAKVAVTLDL